MPCVNLSLQPVLANVSLSLCLSLTGALFVLPSTTSKTYLSSGP